MPSYSVSRYKSVCTIVLLQIEQMCFPLIIGVSRNFVQVQTELITSGWRNALFLILLMQSQSPAFTLSSLQAIKQCFSCCCGINVILFKFFVYNPHCANRQYVISQFASPYHHSFCKACCA